MKGEPAHRDPDRVSPLGCLREAISYHCAAVTVHDRFDCFETLGSDVGASPTYSLLGHAIELSLKSLLLADGLKPKELSLKPYGHDIKN